ncbi:protein of unknown function [Chryseobacterium sp. JV274]|nr:protein of unknown function [Chryseobacterium sp. JV274]
MLNDSEVNLLLEEQEINIIPVIINANNLNFKTFILNYLGCTTAGH